MTIDSLAKICYEAWRAYLQEIGMPAGEVWELAEQAICNNMIAMVRSTLTSLTEEPEGPAALLGDNLNDLSPELQGMHRIFTGIVFTHKEVMTDA